ncbi:MAG: phytanoyl-CoA dioxygenase family protein [Planctomycetes bacterium]|nr:phytanoyl-CoA dioxygenase family protein [Planctomycetota bacterium]
MLTPLQKAFFWDQGYLRVEKLFGPKEIQALSDELDWVFETWADHNAQWQGPWRDQYLTEEQKKAAKLVAINDFHLHSALWNRVAADPRITEVVSDLIGPDVELHHTTLHAKPPAVGSPFPMHQDHAFYAHEGHAYVDTLLHIDPAPVESGCIQFLPGSHKAGALPHILDGAPHLPTDRYRLADAVSVAAGAGDLVLFHLCTVHGSDLNRSGQWRRIVRLGYRSPANRQTAGYALGRPGPMVLGRRPKGVAS